MKELVVTWNNGQAGNLKHTLYFQNKSIGFKQDYDTCLIISDFFISRLSETICDATHWLTGKKCQKLQFYPNCPPDVYLLLP